MTLRHKIRLRYTETLRAKEAAGTAPKSWYEAGLPEQGLVQFPHALASAFDAISRLEIAQNDLAERYRDAPARRRKAGVMFMIDRNEAFPLAFAIDSFLESGVRAQNGAWDYVVKALAARQLPASLRDVVSGLKKSQYTQLPSALRQSIVTYWDNTGERLRDYRVQSQHFALVPSTVNLWYADDGTAAVYLALPSDPKATSPLKIRYENPPTLAYPYCTQAFEELLKWIYELAEIVAPEIAEPSTVIPHTVYGRDTSGNVMGYTVDEEGSFARTVAALIEKERQRTRGTV